MSLPLRFAVYRRLCYSAYRGGHLGAAALLCVSLPLWFAAAGDALGRRLSFVCPCHYNLQSIGGSAIALHTQYHTTNIRFSISYTLNITHPTSHTQHHTLNITHLTSHTQTQTPNITHPTSHIRHHPLNITHPISHNWHHTLNIMHTQYHTPDIAHSISYTQYYTTDIRLSISYTLNIKHPTSHAQHHTLNITHSISDTQQRKPGSILGLSYFVLYNIDLT